MRTLSGSYEVNIDRKRRASLPSKLIRQFGTRTFYLYPHNNQIDVLPEETYTKVLAAEGISSLPAEDEKRQSFCRRIEFVVLDDADRILFGEAALKELGSPPARTPLIVTGNIDRATFKRK
jgi:DNA-binding transcriptional regulator/RsmH inhibitor MraZ